MGASPCRYRRAQRGSQCTTMSFPDGGRGACTTAPISSIFTCHAFLSASQPSAGLLSRFALQVFVCLATPPPLGTSCNSPSSTFNNGITRVSFSARDSQPRSWFVNGFHPCAQILDIDVLPSQPHLIVGISSKCFWGNTETCAKIK